ncbi:MAG: DegT/DnrJ/EryC1/StrS family aminotransferase, partial [Proteobacteria bacterium]|nr:DegT/DnrJ/EryC1/StrS family aminotransferase [Pseudomonadota bacterium]
MNVPLLDLKPQLAALRPQILAAVTRVIDSTGYILGPEVANLEQNIARYCGAGHGIGLSSGTDALLAALMSLAIGPGDLVLTTP